MSMSSQTNIQKLVPLLIPQLGNHQRKLNFNFNLKHSERHQLYIQRTGPKLRLLQSHLKVNFILKIREA